MEMIEVPFGKYKGKDVTQLLADRHYVDWCKQKNILEKYPAIYNIVCSISTDNKDQPTPEHNKMQNEFLEKNLIVSLFKQFLKSALLNTKEELTKKDFVQYYGEQNVNFDEVIEKSIVKIVPEDKFNWDICVYLRECKLRFTHINQDKDEKQAFYKEKWLNELNLLLCQLEKEYAETQKKVDEMYQDLINERDIVIRSMQFEYKEKWKAPIGDYEQHLYDYEKILCSWSSKPNILSDVIDSVTGKLKPHWRHLLPAPKKPTFSTSKFTGEEPYRKNRYITPTSDSLEFQTFRDKVLDTFDKQYEEDFETLYYKDYRREKYIKLFDHTRILCELKPVLGEEYPSVLRKMRDQIDNTKNADKYFSGQIIPILITKTLDLEVTTEPQIRAAFKAHNIHFLTMADLQNDQLECKEHCVNPDALLEKLRVLQEENKKLRKTLKSLGHS
jgi:hypothetical protein